MARYTPRKATLVVRDDTTQDKSANDALTDWMKSNGVKEGDTNKIDQVVSVAKDQGLTFYKMQHVSRLASMLPHVSVDADPLDRILYVLEDPGVKSFAERQVKSMKSTMNHEQAMDSAKTMIPIIEEVTGDNGSDVPPATMMVCIAAGKEIIDTVVEDLPFSPGVEELAVRVQERKTVASSLYPGVSKDNQFTHADYTKKQNRFTTPKKTDFYDVGEKVSNTMSKEFMDMDEEANDLLMQGYNLKEVVKFHNRAPQGYWETVAKEMDDDPDADFDQIYDKLEPQFNFHPDNREPLQ